MLSRCTGDVAEAASARAERGSFLAVAKTSPVSASSRMGPGADAPKPVYQFDATKIPVTV